MPPEHRQLLGDVLHKPCAGLGAGPAKLQASDQIRSGHSSGSWQRQELSLHCCVCGDFQDEKGLCTPRVVFNHLVRPTSCRKE